MKWKLKKTLIDNITARDTTIFFYSDLWWLFTNTDNGNCGDPCSELNIFYSNNPIYGEWHKHQKNPIIIDPNKARMGGILYLNDAIYRVAQSQGFNLYGHSTKVFRINLLNSNNYKEELVTELDSSFYKSAIGTHHLHSSGQCTVFDYFEETNIN